MLAHGEIADIGHFNVDPTLDASRGVFSDFGWRQIIVASRHHHDRALSAIDLFELFAQIMIDGVEVKVALEGFRALSIVVPAAAPCLAAGHAWRGEQWPEATPYPCGFWRGGGECWLDPGVSSTTSVVTSSAGGCS